MLDIFDLFTKYQVLPREIVEQVGQFCEQWNVSGYKGFLHTNVMSEMELADKLAFYLKMDRIYAIQPGEAFNLASEFIPYAVAREWECFPIVTLTPRLSYEVILTDPTQRERIEWLRKRANYQLILAVGERKDILKAIQEYYPLAEQLDRAHKEE